MVRKRGSNIVLLTKDGKKVLQSFPIEKFGSELKARQEALKREKQIAFQKKRDGKK
jgi:hypothetical protein